MIADTSRRNNVYGVVFAGHHASLHRTRYAVAARFAHRDLDDTARRIGVVVGTRNGDHFDLLHILGVERAKVGRQIVAREVQHSIIDHNACARRAIDRDLVALNPHTGSSAENLHTVFANRYGGVIRHIDHKAVGLAGDQSSRYDHLANRVRGGGDCYIAQVGRCGDIERAVIGRVADILNGQNRLTLDGRELEATLRVGCDTRALGRVGGEDYDRCKFDGLARFVHHATAQRVGVLACSRCRRDGECQDDQKKCKKSFHNCSFCCFIFRYSCYCH